MSISVIATRLPHAGFVQFRDNQMDNFWMQYYAEIAYSYARRPMNLKQIEAFEAVATLGTTTAAAQRLEISQSVVSRLLAQLEEDFGLRLFIREQGRLTLTREGSALVDEVKTLIDSANCLERHAQQLRLGGMQRRLVRVMVPNTIAQHAMPRIMESFYEAHKDAVMEVVSGAYEQAERALLSREIDLGFVQVPPRLPGLQVHRTFFSKSACVIPADHPLSALDKITAFDLETVPLVLIGRQSLHRREVDMAFRRAGRAPWILAEVHSVGVACAMVAQGIGVAIVTELLAACCPQEGLVIKPFEPALPFHTGLATLVDTPKESMAVALLTAISDALSGMIV